MPSRWIEVTVSVAREHSDAVGNFLIEVGAPGIECIDNGDSTQLRAHFPVDPPLDDLHRYCAALEPSMSRDICRIVVREIADQDWAQNWKLHSRPQLVGESLYICPSWAAAPPAGRTAVIIDPGMAFGTGQHATTRGCLRLLERAVRGRQITRALDVGTGSGILAITLARLGVRDVCAVDTDPTARAVAAANATTNGVDPHIHILPGLDAVPGSVDLIVANLYANLLRELAPALVMRLRASGILIASGFLGGDEERVRQTYEAHGLTGTWRDTEETWVTLEFCMQGSQ